MFHTENTTDRIDNDSFVTNNGATVMLYKSTSTYNRIKTLVAAIVIMATALFSVAAPASADTAGPVPGFTPDGVNFIPAAGFDGQDAQVLAYLNGGNHSPDGISNLQSNGQTSPVIAMWTPDGVNQIETVDGPATAQQQVLAYMNGGNHSPDGVSNSQSNGQTSPVIAMWTPDGVNQIETVDGPATARQQVLAYLNGGNHSPDGVSNLQNNGRTSPVIAMFTPDGVNQIETVDGPATARQQVLAYLNGGKHSPDGISNLQSNGQTSPVIAMWTPDGVNQIETVDGPATARQQVLAYLNGGNHSPDGVSNLQSNGQGGADVPDLAYYYAGIANPSQVG